MPRIGGNVKRTIRLARAGDTLERREAWPPGRDFLIKTGVSTAALVGLERRMALVGWWTQRTGCAFCVFLEDCGRMIAVVPDRAAVVASQAPSAV